MACSSHRHHHRAHLRGFTLIEMLLVVTIIGVLAGVIATSLSGRSEEARVARARADITGSISLALDLFERDTGRYPTTDEGLAALVTNPGIDGWKGPYLKNGLKPDPWGRAYAYTLVPAIGEATLAQYQLSSMGKDGQPGTEDDVTP